MMKKSKHSNADVEKKEIKGEIFTPERIDFLSSSFVSIIFSPRRARFSG
jgi:hypothetical protein